MEAAFMHEAIELSRQGFPAPNPRVGAVVVSQGNVVGRGHHSAAGQKHAEVMALEEAGRKADGADIFVTLEPCAHHGRTPPCTDAIVAAGIRRVVFAVGDPNPEAAGGAEKLAKAGICVEVGPLAEEAAAVNRVFLRSFELGRPFVLAKAAITLDGKIADAEGKSKWITGLEARTRAHWLRAELGCVLVGATTVERDDPSLTVRHVEVVNQPLRVVLDPKNRLPSTHAVFSDGGKTMHVTGKIDLATLLGNLWKEGIRGVLVEGGGKTIGAFFKAGLVDALELHVASRVFGSGVPWVQVEASGALDRKIRNVVVDRLGDDLRITGDIAN
jgi:diaminohydroxyphosphoribosylaminopyrimidine deaminase/5-amino-6-(5-phosphoribosylamino)uracil reductase